MKTKTNKANVVTIKTRAATAIAADILKGLQGIESAKESIGAVYKEAAAALDGIHTAFTNIRWNSCKSPESTKAAFTAADIDDAQGKRIQEFRAVILEAVKAYNEQAAKTVWQSICRWSIGYSGSKPLHPDIKPTATNTPTKADKADKADTTTSVRDAVLANPQKARIVLGELVAAFSTLQGACKKNKLSTALLQEILDQLGETDAAIAALK
jgi:hypothetical protein